MTNAIYGSNSVITLPVFCLFAGQLILKTQAVQGKATKFDVSILPDISFHQNLKTSSFFCNPMFIIVCCPLTRSASSARQAVKILMLNVVGSVKVSNFTTRESSDGCASVFKINYQNKTMFSF